MRYTPIPISDRTRKIKEEYLKMPVALETDPYVDKKYRHFNSGDRWITLAFLEGWFEHRKTLTTLRRRSYAEANELLAAKPVITDDELLLGHL